MPSPDAAATSRHPLAAAALLRGDPVAALAALGRPTDPAGLRLAGRALLALGDRSGAGRAMESALAAAESAADAAQAHRELAVIARTVGELGDAIAHLERALTLAPPQACHRLHREAADLAHRMGRLDDAERHASAAMDAGGGASELDRAHAGCRLGAVLAERGRSDDAVEYLRQAVTQLARHLPEGHVDVIAAQTELAGALRCAGARADAARTLSGVLGLREAALGRTHPALATTLLDLSALHEELGDAAPARAFAQRAVEVLQGRVPADHPALRDARARAAD